MLEPIAVIRNSHRETEIHRVDLGQLIKVQLSKVETKYHSFSRLLHRISFKNSDISWNSPNQDPGDLGLPTEMRLTLKVVFHKYDEYVRPSKSSFSWYYIWIGAPFRALVFWRTIMSPAMLFIQPLILHSFAASLTDMQYVSCSGWNQAVQVLFPDNRIGSRSKCLFPKCLGALSYPMYSKRPNGDWSNLLAHYVSHASFHLGSST